MSPVERENEITPYRAVFFNAVGVGAIVAGGVCALTDGSWFFTFAFSLFGLAMQGSGAQILNDLKILERAVA